MKLIHFLQYVFLTAIIMFGGYYLYCMYYPYKVIDVQNVTIAEKMKVGDALDYTLTYCKYIDISPIVYRKLVDGVIYTLNNSPARIPTGCNSVIINAGHVPNVPTGVYTLRLTSVYQVNAFREVVVDSETNEFTIAE